jgi:HK97 gp10 family phage protein
MARSGVRIEVKRNDFAKIAGLLAKDADAIAGATATAVETDWKAGVHVRTGRYRNSIRKERTGRGQYTVTTDVPYAVFQENGTRFMTAHPAMVPAVERNTRTFLARMANLESDLT